MHEAQDATQELYLLKEAVDQHDIVSIADVNGNIIHVNDKFCQVSILEGRADREKSPYAQVRHA